jgi:hypothetical protein
MKAAAATERVQNELELGALHQAVLVCLRGQSALAGCSIAPEVLYPIISLSIQLLGSGAVKLVRWCGAAATVELCV